MGSLVVANMVNKHRKEGTWNHKIKRFIALTDFAKNKFIEAGFPSDKIAVKANFIHEPTTQSLEVTPSTSGFALFVGRISKEKGIKTLLHAWTALGNDLDLKVAGTGPLENMLTGRNNVVNLGRRNSGEISVLMRQATFLVLPSEWYEGFPLVLVEAFAHGLPVLASRLGSMADIIQDGENGLLFSAGDASDLALKAKWLLENPLQAQRIAENARQTYLAKYSAEKNYEQLMAIYAEALR